MKKTLAILGLLVCSTGFVFADEVTTTDVTQQVEIQNNLDRTNFENMDKNRKFNKSLESDKKADKIKFDKSVNDKKYKNFDKKGKYSDKDKGDVSKKQKFAKDRLNPKFDKNFPNKYSNKHPQKPMNLKKAHKPHHHYSRYSHNPRMNRYHRHSNNIRRPNNFRRG